MQKLNSIFAPDKLCTLQYFKNVVAYFIPAQIHDISLEFDPLGQGFMGSESLNQACTTYVPRAKRGPPSVKIWPANTNEMVYNLF